MKTPTLSITISGITGSGKTTVARIIEQALKKAGFQDVTNIDANEANRKEGLWPIEADRVRRWTEGRPVRILTAQTRATGGVSSNGKSAPPPAKTIAFTPAKPAQGPVVEAVTLPKAG